MVSTLFQVGGSTRRLTEGQYYNSESLRPKEQSESYFCHYNQCIIWKIVTFFRYE